MCVKQKICNSFSPKKCLNFVTHLTKLLSAKMALQFTQKAGRLKPGFHIVVSVVSVVSVVRKKFIGQLQLYGNLPYKCSIQKKRHIQLVVRDRMNSICPMNYDFFSYNRHDK